MCCYSAHYLYSSITKWCAAIMTTMFAKNVLPIMLATRCPLQNGLFFVAVVGANPDQTKLDNCHNNVTYIYL